MLKHIVILVLIFFISINTIKSESPEELLNKTPLVNLEEFAFLLAMHGYNVAYVDGIYLLNRSDLSKQYSLS